VESEKSLKSEVRRPKTEVKKREEIIISRKGRKVGIWDSKIGI